MTWQCSAARDLPFGMDNGWDGAAAEQAIFAWATDSDGTIQSSKAKRAFLLWNDDDGTLKGNYAFPFCIVSNGELKAEPAGLRACASYLPKGNQPEGAKADARKVLDGYFARLDKKKSGDPGDMPLTDYAARSKRPMEFRYAELRTVDDGAEPGFDGYASTFWAVDSKRTAMAPGAFKRSLQHRGAKPFPLLYQHVPSDNIGRAVLSEDEYGLRASCAVCDDGGLGSVVMKRLRFGVPFAMSFGFNTLKDRTATDDDPLDLAQMPDMRRSDVRVLTEVALWEPSVVTFPANAAATIDHVRADTELAALAAVLDALKEDRLTPAQRALMAELVTAWTGPASDRADDPSGAAPRTPATSHDWLSEFAILAAQGGYQLEYGS